MTENTFQVCEHRDLELSSDLQNQGRAFCDTCRASLSNKNTSTIENTTAASKDGKA